MTPELKTEGRKSCCEGRITEATNWRSMIDDQLIDRCHCFGQLSSSSTLQLGPRRPPPQRCPRFIGRQRLLCILGGLWGMLPRQQHCSLVGGVLSSTLTAHGFVVVAAVGPGGCYSLQKPSVHIPHLWSFSCFQIYGIDSPPLPLLFFFLLVETPRRVYRVLTPIRPLGLFSPRVCSKACVQGLPFSFSPFAPLYLSLNLYSMA